MCVEGSTTFLKTNPKKFFCLEWRRPGHSRHTTICRAALNAMKTFVVEAVLQRFLPFSLINGWHKILHPNEKEREKEREKKSVCIQNMKRYHFVYDSINVFCTLWIEAVSECSQFTEASHLQLPLFKWNVCLQLKTEFNLHSFVKDFDLFNFTASKCK